MLVDFAPYTLRESSELITVATSQENADAALGLVQQCKLKVDIISRHLDPPLYNQLLFIEAIKKLVLSSRHVVIRILVFEPKSVSRGGHRLFDLAGKVSSFIELRKPHAKHHTFNETFMIVDEVGYLFRKSSALYEGEVNFNDRRRASNLLKVFNDIWESAQADPELRKMRI